MKKCDTCGNDYDRMLEIFYDGRKRTFDCFECAIHSLAPVCKACGCRVIGHGVQVDDQIYCCAHCAEAVGQRGIRDRTTGARR